MKTKAFPGHTQPFPGNYLTYRKYGGICTICLQNASAAMTNGAIQNIVSNSDFKLFLDQGANDRNVLAGLINMSEEEFQALSNPEVGQCLLVWGGRIILCDSRIPKDNPLYELYTTNLHEKAKEKAASVMFGKSAHGEEKEKKILEAPI